MMKLLYGGTKTIPIIRGLIACFLGSKRIAAAAQRMMTIADEFMFVSTSRS